MLGEFEKVMPTPDEVEGLHNSGDFSQPLGYANTEKSALLLLSNNFSQKKEQKLFVYCAREILNSGELLYTKHFFVPVISSYDMFVQICL